MKPKIEFAPGTLRHTCGNRVCTFALLLLVWSVLHSAAAVRFDVFLGYDGIIPEARWFPVTFEVENNDPTFTAVVELTSNQMERNQRRTITIELPTGTTKRFVLPVFGSGRYVSTWDARLLDQRGKVRAEMLGVRPRRMNPWNLPVFGSVSRTPALLPQLQQPPPEGQLAVARLLPNLFPDNPVVLEGLGTVYLSSERALELNVNQVNALLSWLHYGGHLVLGVEQPLHVTANEWLRPLLPCEITGMGQATNLAALHEWLTSPIADDRTFDSVVRQDSGYARSYMDLSPGNFPHRMPLQVATAKFRDQDILIGSRDQPLALRAERGRGLLTVLLFNPELEPFLSWTLRPNFWARMAAVPPQVLSGAQQHAQAHQGSDGIFGAMVDSKQVRKLPVGWLLLLLTAYLVVIGPLDYYWLKKINRQMLTWITFPLYVAGFTVLIYFIGYRLRAGDTEWNELHVVDVLPRKVEAQLRGRTFGSIYSPVNANYRFTNNVPYGTVRGEYMGIHGGRDSGRAQIEQVGNSFSAEIEVPVWTSQLYISDWVSSADEPLAMTIQRQGQSWQVTVQNNTGAKLDPVKVVLEGMIYDLGRLDPAQSKTLILEGGTSLTAFVHNHGNTFQAAISQRQRAFGENRAYIANVPNSTMAISFLKELTGTEASRQFITPSGLELPQGTDRSSAVLLAWQAGGAPIAKLNTFSVRRGRRDTLWRLVVALREP